jgi:hypothetical protein
MTQIKDYLIVPVPEGAEKFKVFLNVLHFRMERSDEHIWVERKRRKVLPEGDWSIVEIDERVAGEIVGKMDGLGFMVYTKPGTLEPQSLNWKYQCKTALESYYSLLRSKGYENVVLLKKK